MISEAQRKLENVFGYESFRPLQEEAIEQVLAKKDALVIMPTGGGKSLCYQIPALLFDGLTIVISPLISLMKDQVEQLRQFDIPALYLNSSLTDEEYQFNIKRLKNGEVKLLYVAPETLIMPKTRELLDGIDVDLFTIDEAHCISEWGHDFRPDYRRLTEVRNDFPNAACLALTATATPRVREDIKKVLDFDDSESFLASFDRKNLLLKVADKEEPLEQVLDFLYTRKKQSGIIYCFSRRQVNALYVNLKQEGYAVRPYHAGLSEKVRNRNQEAFIRDDVDIIVATIAFGMGINKPDVRYVIHYDMPKDIESYYQQIGRAGRDGLRADCLVLYSHSDTQKIRYFINKKEGKEKKIAEQHLNSLIDFLETNKCRRIPLMDYFGEEYPNEECGMCDNCLSVDAEVEDLTDQSQTLISCIEQTGGQFGEYYLANVLRGTKTDKILDNGHHKISSFGAGKDWGRDQWIQLLRMLDRQSYIDKSDEGHLKINEQSLPVIKNQEKVYGLLNRTSAVVGRKATARTTPEVEKQYDQDLFKKLKEERKNQADEHSVAPYAIFPDTTLMEMAYFFPKSKDSLMKIYGVGTAKCKHFGKAFLKIIIGYCEEHNISERKKSLEAKSKPKHDGKPHEQIAKAFNNGQSIEHLAEEKGVKPVTILKYLKKYLEEGHDLRAEGIAEASSLSKRKRDEVLASFNNNGRRLLRSVYEDLNKSVSYSDLRVMKLYDEARQ
ncbi:MAG TPA: DNA helicase RecQ [Balneolaceae bacterium]|nr:DNA helicase RecQ [Balneolaceae bacterium]